MKKSLLITSLVFSAVCALAQVKKPVVQPKAGAQAPAKDVNVTLHLDVSDIRNDVGQWYVLPPQDPKWDYIYTHAIVNGKEEKITGLSKNLLLKINKVDIDTKMVWLTDSAGKQYESEMYHMFKMHDLYKFSYLDTLRKTFLNKTLWLKNWGLPTEEEHDMMVDGQSVGKAKRIGNDKYHFQPVLVTGVELTGRDPNPYRLRIMSKDNIAGAYDFDFVTVPLQTGRVNKLSEEFFGFDPVQKYHLTPIQLKAIKAGEVNMGMSDVIVELIKGEPDHINFSTSGTIHQQQWVYKEFGGQNSYYYFNNGKLTAQN